MKTTSSGHDVRRFDTVDDPEDDGVDVVAFANFMRSTKAPPRGPINETVTSGEGILHASRVRDVPHPNHPHRASQHAHQWWQADRAGGACGQALFIPYSDFLLHDIGTGDGIPVLPDAEFASTASQIRTAPLWALRTRNRLMHDGLSFTKEAAISRHGGQASRAQIISRWTDRCAEDRASGVSRFAMTIDVFSPGCEAC